MKTKLTYLLLLLAIFSCSKEAIENEVQEQPTAPELVHPKELAFDVPTDVTVRWNLSEDINGDDIEYSVYYNIYPTNWILAGKTSSTSMQLSLEPNTGYYWYVSASDGETYPAESSSRVFKTETHTKIADVSPQTAFIGEETTFTITGSDLTDDLIFKLDDLNDIFLVGLSEDKTELKFKGTPTGMIGHKSGRIMAADETELMEISLKYSINTNMVFVQGGTFQMGKEEGREDEMPAHNVNLSNYYIAKFETTQAQWEAVMGNDWTFPFTGDNLPADAYISWNDAIEFIAKLNEISDNTYRLPTEAEWEFAAIGGNQSRGYTYSGSNTLDDVAWYYSNSGDSYLDNDDWSKEQFIENNNRSHSVGTKLPNELGIYDMNGNSWEYCNDWYDADYYSISPLNNPQGGVADTTRVFRGGGFYNTIQDSKHIRDDWRPEKGTLRGGGFRLACTVLTNQNSQAYRENAFQFEIQENNTSDLNTTSKSKSKSTSKNAKKGLDAMSVEE